MAVQELNKVLYTDQDFSTAVANIQSFINTNYPAEFNDYVSHQIGQMLIDIIAYAEQNLMWYLNRKVTDLYFPTAVTANAVSKLARMLGYKSKGATSSATEITVTLKNGPYTFPVIIPVGFQFRAKNNSIWEYRGSVPITFNPGETSKTFQIDQGNTVVNNFISNGNNGQVFYLRSVPIGRYVNAASLTVKVDGVEWPEYSVIPFDNISAYESNLLAFPPFIKFGDGVQGAIPPSGSGIEVSYVITDGFNGRIASDSISSDPVTPLTAQFQTIPILVSQSSSSVGGDDPEDTRSIAVNAAKFQRVQDRAITKGDYDYLSNLFDNVARADAQIIRGVSGDIFLNTMLPAIDQVVYDTLVDFEAKSVSSFDAMEADLAIISGSVSSFDAAFSGHLSAVSGDILTKVSQIDTGINSTLVTHKSVMDALFDSVTTDTQDIHGEMIRLQDNVDTIIDVRKTNIKLVLDQINNAVSGCGSTVQSQVSGYVTLIKSKLDDMQSAVATENASRQVVVDSEITDIGTQLNSANTELESVSGDVYGAVSGYYAGIESDLGTLCAYFNSDMAALESSVSGAFVDMQLNFNDIAANVAAVSGLYQTVSGYVDAVSGYLSEHLSDSCRANIVQVSVLGKDSLRKYVAPLQSTLDGLKDYLSDRKDVTHTVSTISGMNNVVNAVLRIEVRVNKNADEDSVVAKIRDSLVKSDAEPLGLLVEREFNLSLYVWDIQAQIRASIGETDVDYLNIKILGPTEFLDTAGNLVIPNGFVIQSGTLTIVKLPRF